MVDDRRKDGELSERVVRLQEQVGRLVSDAESEKDTRRRVSQSIESRFVATEGRIGKIERTIWTAAGALAIVVLLAEWIMKHF